MFTINKFIIYYWKGLWAPKTLLKLTKHVLEGKFLRFSLGEISWNPPTSGKSVPGPRLRVSLKPPLWDAVGGGATNKATSSPKWSGYTTDSSIYVTRPLTSAAVTAAGAKAAMML